MAVLHGRRGEQQREKVVGVKLSVLMTLYDAEFYLGEAIESILAQTFVDFELILVDDGSTDNSLTIIRDYERRDRRIRVIGLASNRGTPHASNVGLKAARAPLIARMDADDVSFPDRLQKQYDYMQQHLEVGLLGASYIAFRDRGGKREALYRVLCPESLSEERFISASLPVAHPTCIYRRGLAQKAGGYREFFRYGAEDLDLFLRLQETAEVANLPEPLLFYRKSQSSVFRSHRLRVQNFALLARLAALKRRAGLCDPVAAKTEQILGRFGLPQYVTLEQLRAIKPQHPWAADCMAEWLEAQPPNAQSPRLYLELANAYRKSPRSLKKTIRTIGKAFMLDRASAMRLIFPTSRKLSGAHSNLPVRPFA